MDNNLTFPLQVELVSIIMPAYNAEKYIAAAINSVLAQTYKNWELLIVDDGSTDATSLIVQGYASRDERVRYFYQENARQGTARNLALAHARGKLIAFLDADDLWLSDKLTKQVTQLENSNVDLIFCQARIFQDELELKSKEGISWGGQGIYSGEAGFAALLAYNPIPILTVLTTKTAIMRANGFATQREIQNVEDYHLWLKMLLTGSVMIGFPTTLAAYRELHTSVSGTDRLNTEQVVEAKRDVAVNFPAVRVQVLHDLNGFIKTNLHKAVDYSEVVFFAQVRRYMAVTNRATWNPLFVVYEKLRLRKLAMKSAYFIFNYL